MSWLETLSHNRRFIITGLLVFFSLGFLQFFSESDKLSVVFQGFIVSVVFFLVIPLLYSKIVLKESLKNLGFQKGNFSQGLLASIAGILAAGSIIVGLALTVPDFQEKYTLPISVETSFLWFVLYELVLVAFITFLYEVFFRGLIQFSWLRDFGISAVIIQAGIFIGFIYLGYGIAWQTVPALIFSPFAGLVAYRSQSIWYSFAASWTFFLFTDIFFLIFH